MYTAQATKAKYERPNSFPHVMPEAGAHQGSGPTGSPPPPPAGASFGSGTATPPPGQGWGASFGTQPSAQASGYAFGAFLIAAHVERWRRAAHCSFTV